MWSSEEICINQADYFDRVRKAMRAAQRQISIEMYIFREDELGQSLLEAAREAAGRGVEVRILVDGVGSPGWSPARIAALERERIDVRIYHPVPSALSAFRWWRFSLAKARALLGSVNKRNHRKLILVDNEIAFVGSCNVAVAHRNWRETAVVVAGQSIADMVRSFELIWALSRRPLVLRSRLLRLRRKPVPSPDSPVRVNYTRKLRQRHNADLLARIERAQERVWITNAYFVPGPAMVAALVRAARHGCDVKILLPSKSDVSIVASVSRIFYRTLLRAGIEIYEYQPSMLHAKTLLIDDWATVGTSNLNYRSVYHDLEVDVVLSAPGSLQALAGHFAADLRCAVPVTDEQLRRRSYLELISGYAIYPFRRFI
jgi:cardiolipin synthase